MFIHFVIWLTGIVLWCAIGIVMLRVSNRGTVLVECMRDDEDLRFYIYLLITVIFWPIQSWALVATIWWDDVHNKRWDL